MFKESWSITCIIFVFGFSKILSQTNYIGIGLNSAKDYEECPAIFADAMKHSRQWVGLDDNMAATVDVDGWPMEDAEVFFGNTEDLHGEYRLSFVGQATPTGFGGNISGVTYNPTTNITTAVFTVTDPTKHYLRLRLTNVGTNGVKQIKIMRPTSPGSNQSYPESVVFTDQIKNAIQRFNVVRYMDFTGSNSDKQHINSEWNTRTYPGYATQSVAWNIVTYQKDNPINGKEWYSYQGKGVSWEHVIQLANETNTDCWINIPHAANDDYINKLALLIKYGSDGRNPYNSIQSNPIFPPLNSNLKLYVEYSNEIWNSGFPAFGYIDSQVALEPSNSNIFYDGSTNQNFRRYRWAARRTVQISNIFRGVFGNDAMHTRIRPLYEWQKGKNDTDYGNANRTGTQGLVFIEKNYPQPVNYYIYGGGGSGYYQANTVTEGATIENLWDVGEFVPQNFAIPKLEYSSFITSAFGIKRIVYEGGPSFGDQNGAGGMNELAPLALQDSRIKDEIISHQNIWTQYGGDLFTFFTLGGDERWGFYQHPTHNNSYKMQGIDVIKNAPAQPVILGQTVSINGTTTIRGDRWMVSNRDNGGTNWRNSTLSDDVFSLFNNVWVSYPFHVLQDGNYEVRLKYSTTGSNTSKILLGGNTLGILSLTNSNGQNAYTEWLPFSSSTYNATSLRIWNQSGANLVIDQLEIKMVGALPVNIVSLYGEREHNTNVLHWQVAQELNVEKYEIEYSENGYLWELAGAILPQGSNSIYEFNHSSDQKIVYYRIKMVDHDSHFEYSKIINIINKTSIEVWSILSNLVSDDLQIYGDIHCVDCKIIIYDITGKVLIQEKILSQTHIVNLSNLMDGQYVCRIMDENDLKLQTTFFKKE